MFDKVYLQNQEQQKGTISSLKIKSIDSQKQKIDSNATYHLITYNRQKLIYRYCQFYKFTSKHLSYELIF